MSFDTPATVAERAQREASAHYAENGPLQPSLGNPAARCHMCGAAFRAGQCALTLQNRPRCPHCGSVAVFPADAVNAVVDEPASARIEPKLIAGEWGALHAFHRDEQRRSADDEDYEAAQRHKTRAEEIEKFLNNG